MIRVQHQMSNKTIRHKLIISVLFFLLFGNILLLNFSPLPGYVYSFYEHIPILFWIFSIVAFFIASLILIEFRSFQIKYVYILYFFLILFNNAIILFSPYMCGAYIMNCGDLPTHGGMVLDIIYKGKIDFNINFYPVTHILAFVISAIGNINYMDSIKLLSPFFSLLLPIYLYILCKEIIDDTFIQIQTFLISSTFYLSSLFQTNTITTPNGLSLLMLPLIFYLFIKNSKKSFAICFILLLTTFLFFHPLTSFMLLFSFSFIYFVGKISKSQIYYNGILYFICGFLAYLFYLTTIWVHPIKNIYYFFSGYAIHPGYAVDISENLDKLGLRGYDLVSFFIKVFGHQAMLLLLSFVSTILLLLRIKNKNSKEIWVITILSFILISDLAFLVQIIIPTAFNISFFRFLLYALVFSPILSSVVLSKFFSAIRLRRSFTIFILLFLFTNSLFVVYPSPYITEMNGQLSLADLSGSRWLLQHKSANIGSSGYFGNGITIRMISGLIPYTEFHNSRYNIWMDKNSILPDHLGYENNSNIWDTVREQRYLIINKYDIIAYTQVYKKVARLSLNDLEKLKRDNTSSLIYFNGEYMNYYISR